MSSEACPGYWAKSANGNGPGVIVIQEWWGLNQHIKDVTDRFAQAGFNAFAPDFYNGKTTQEPDEAGSLMMALQIDQAAELIHRAVAEVLVDPATSTKKVGVVGFCMGGQLSMYAACIDAKIGACVNFYGIHPNVLPNFENLKAPMLGFFAEHDDYASPQVVKVLDQTLSDLGKEHEFTVFEGRHHAFFNSDRPAVYDQRAADECWELMVKFFNSQLR